MFKFEYVLTDTQYYQDIADAIRRKKAEIDKNLVSIAVTTPPTKTSYKATEEVSYSGLVVTATFDNNTSFSECFSVMKLYNYFQELHF